MIDFVLPSQMEALAESIRDKRPFRQIQRIQNFFVHYRYFVHDEMLTPSEMQAAGGGDCKAFAVAKYFILLRAGVSMERLHLVHMRLPDKSYHAAIQYDDQLIDRIRDTYTIPNVPARIHVSWNHAEILHYWPFASWGEVPYESYKGDGFVHRFSRYFREWRNLLSKIRSEVESGKLLVFERMLCPSVMELAALEVGERVNLRDLSSATLSEIDYLQMRHGGDFQALLNALSPRGKTEFRRYLERNHDLLVAVHNKTRMIQ